MSKKENQSTLRAQILRAITKSKTPLKMSQIAVKVGLVEAGKPVPSGVGARVRVQLKHLLEDRSIAATGEKATRVYCSPDLVPVTTKPSKKVAKKVAKKKPAAAPKKKKAKQKKAAKK